MSEVEFGVAIWLLLVAWGCASTLRTTATRGEKIFWLLVLAVPAIGFLGWFWGGPGSKALPGLARDL